ncbi:MAG: UbiD family decarboxylase [Magnetococcales bacterium]|nr:UbiD family decarboxylase [Magnetococcales bacterium]
MNKQPSLTTSPRSFRDLREFMAFLSARGLLVRVDAPVDPRLEMTEICRRLLHSGGPAVLFTRPVGHRMPVLANLFGTEERVGLAMGRQVAELEELGRLLAALRQPEVPRGLRDVKEWIMRMARARYMPTRTLSKPPCREQVWEGAAVDLKQLPVQTCWPGDAAPLITWGVVVSRGPDGGPLNLGVYRLQVLDRHRVIMRWLAHRGGAQHLRAWGGRPMPVSVVVGCDPGLLLAAVTPVPESLSEYAFAGLLRERRVEVAPEHDVYPPVPAFAEIVLEGMVDPNDRAEEGPYGDHTGYYNEVDTFPVLTVRRMSLRKEAIYLSTFTGRPPDEPAILALALNRVFTPLLTKQYPEIRGFHLSMEACSYRVAVVALEKGYPGHAFRVMAGLWGFLRQFLYVKYIVVVDAGVAIGDWGAVLVEMEKQVHGGRDLHVLRNTPIDYLDFSSPLSGLGGKMGVDATSKWPVERQAVTPMAPVRGEAVEMWMERLRSQVDGVLEGFGLPLGRMAVVRVDSRGRMGVGRRVLAWLASGEGADQVWVVDWDVRVDSLADLSWSLATRTDPGRDVWVDGVSGRWAVDATMRSREETGREWGVPLVMDPGVEAKVSQQWSSYGLPHY